MTQTPSRTFTASEKSSSTTEVWTRNEVIFMGHVGKDPEMNYTNSSKAVTKFSLSVYQGKNKDPMWLNTVAWEELAEHINEHVLAGDRVEIKGYLTQRKYEGKYYHDVVIQSLEIIETKKERERKKTEAAARRANKNGSQDLIGDLDDLGDLDDHPF